MGKDIENTGDVPEREVISWHALTVDECIAKLRADPDLCKKGLTSSEAARRLEEYGPNKMSEAEKETLCQKIWKQVANVLVCILVVVALVSAARGIVEQVAVEEPNSTTILTSWVQVGLIVTVITVNTCIGILQEGSAEKAAEALKNMLSADARVIRDGKEMMIPAIEVVPGDVIILSLGDRCPADMRVIESTNLACQEAALTGEAVPIDKKISVIDVPQGSNPEQIALGDRHNMTFSATLVAQGSGVGIAIATGDETQIGTINKLVSQVEKKKTNVLEQIDQVSKLLAVLILIATLTTFFIAFFAAEQSAFEAVSTSLVCCVAMIPEGLEAIVTLVYAWATTNMAKQNAIIRALPAVETLGSVTVICSDKTGTLTQNVMSLTAFVTSNAHYKFDVNATDRVPTNFVREDSYLAERAQHQFKRSVSQVIKDGANSGAPRKGHIESSNHYSIDTSLHPVEVEDGAAPSSVPSDFPFPIGGSPTSEWVKNALSVGVLCSKCVLGENGGREGEIGNPTELSILRAAYFSGISIESLKKETPIVAEVPFSSEYKFMATVHDTGDAENYDVFVKGAPDRMVKLCSTQAKGGVVTETEPINSNYWIEKIAVLSSHGLRVLALCRATVPKSSVVKGENLGPEFVNGRPEMQWLTIIGLCAIMDPPRPECVQAIREAKGAGVRVAMITGDHKDTATAIGHMLGIVDENYPSAITGPELDEMSDEEMKDAVMTYNVFARASPQNKIRIVKALQAQKQISSMTGDGVNDAPALKAADMGVAMGKEGTDVAREASEMILADDNFATIVTAVKEGRTVWDNLRKVLYINTPINNAQGMSVLFGLAFGLNQSPLSPIQVLYSNLICAITLGFVAAIEPAEEGIMSLPPRRIGKRLIGRYLLLRILLATLTLTCLVVASAFWLKSYNPDGLLFSKEDGADPNNPKNSGLPEPELVYYLEDIRATAFNVLDFGAISITLSARFTYLSSIHPRVFRGNKSAWYSVFIVAALQIITTYVPGLNTIVFQMRGMDGRQWGIVMLFMVIVFLVLEAEKALRSYLKFRGADTDDLQYGVFDNPMEGEVGKNEALLPKGASHLNLVSLEK
eukprot:CAMPEP_0176499750 /NCGR_PEP_ID=MMETSP0200_2-20121128/13114_1 /TAXON_ID=947934 /ORGANISM="Chaetoceros sp., Strain GSL56" /LENGTH=1087 /DNA_ID=CAMNT_0017898231 /DNA_START=79 /DNA_END=3342 /DNA_ORIENTATION=-